MPAGPPVGFLPLREAWEELATGLHVQRLALHLQEWREVVHHPPAVALFTEAAPAALGARPAQFDGSRSRALVEAAGLTAWTDLPRRYGTSEYASTLLAPAAEDTAALIIGQLTDAGVRDAVRAVTAAAAWWTGFFAALHHRGVHHLTLDPVTSAISVATLQRATRAVALGTAERVLRHQLHTEPVTEDVRLAYCRVITEGIVWESSIPALLEDLGELRLVDLVSTSLPWRGQYTKYAGGTGAGQVE
ncbi:hypothetical protein ACFY1P_20480 [Streptomyces sp. NPDC001407]|uniref:hypothetical protein n=1 Tax=Streptomyces sp. NPDC001407 TaxID=3364573 RepID=UPI0036CFB9D5